MKQTWKPGNMLYPLPAVMVSVTDGKGNDNIITQTSHPKLGHKACINAGWETNQLIS